MKRYFRQLFWFLALLLILIIPLVPTGSFAQSVDRLFQRGLTAYEQGRYSDAEAIWQQIIALDPDNVYAHNNLGNTLYIQGKLDEAIAAYRTALALPDVDGDPASAHTLAYANLGDALRDQGSLAEAVEAYQRAIDLNDRFALGYSGLGSVLLLQGRLDDSIAACNAALGLADVASFPTSAHGMAYTTLGQAFQAQGNLEQAIESYSSALAIDPNYNVAQTSLAQAEQALLQPITSPEPERDEEPTPITTQTLGAALRSAVIGIFEP